MLFLRIAIIGLLMAWLASRAIQMLRDGSATFRGGVTITRRRNSGWFWASIAVQFTLLAAGLAYLWSLI
jgi:hypothetical protein